MVIISAYSIVKERREKKVACFEVCWNAAHRLVGNGRAVVCLQVHVIIQLHCIPLPRTVDEVCDHHTNTVFTTVEKSQVKLMHFVCIQFRC